MKIRTTCERFACSLHSIVTPVNANDGLGDAKAKIHQLVVIKRGSVRVAP